MIKEQAIATCDQGHKTEPAYWDKDRWVLPQVETPSWDTWRYFNMENGNHPLKMRVMVRMQFCSWGCERAFVLEYYRAPTPQFIDGGTITTPDLRHPEYVTKPIPWPGG